MDISDVESEDISSPSSGEDNEVSPWRVKVSNYERSMKDAISALETIEDQNDEESPEEMAESRSLSNFWELEQRMIFLQRHLTVINLYMVTISKCDREDDICDYCQNHPWRGSYSHTSRKDTICDQRCLGGPLCRHTINKELMESIEYFNLLTPSSLKLPRKCGICRQEGHTRRNCPQKQLVNTF